MDAVVKTHATRPAITSRMPLLRPALREPASALIREPGTLIFILSPDGVRQGNGKLDGAE
jgi:hypothetical protein